MRVTVLGATGGIGGAIVRELHGRGHAVTAVSRTIAVAHVPGGVAIRPADVADRAAAQAACADADVVVMAVNLPYQRWAAELGPLTENALEAASTANARFVMVDNLYAYGSPGVPISDTTPETATTRKGALRRELGQRLLAAHRDGRARVTLGRLSDYYGPGPYESSVVNLLAIRRAVRGKVPRAFIAADQPHTFHYLPDAARGFTALIEQPAADGRSWILPSPPAITQRELLTFVTRAAGLPPKIGLLGRRLLWLAGLADAQLREAREIVAQFDRPYVTRADGFEAAFGPVATTPHEQAIAETVAYFRAGRRVAPADHDQGESGGAPTPPDSP